MNTSIPVGGPPPDPSTPGTTASPTALGAAVTTGTIGAVPAALVVWFLDTYVHPGGHKMDATTAALAASWLSSVIGYGFYVLKGLTTHLIEKP